MSEPPTNGPFRRGRRVDPNNLPGRRPRRSFLDRLFGRNRVEQPRRPPPPEEPEPQPRGPDTPPEEAPERYEPERFGPFHEFQYQRGARGLSPEDDQHARELYRRGFIDRGPGSKHYRDEYFDFTGQDPRNFDWEEWRREAGS